MAWSFDRLRLWCERGVPPERALRNAWVEVAVRCLVVALSVGWAVAVQNPVPLIIGLVGMLLPPCPSTPAARRCRYSAERTTG